MELEALVQNRALVRVTPGDLCQPAFFSLKASGGFRLVVVVSRLNGFIDCPHFLMETVDSIVRAMRPGDWSLLCDRSVGRISSCHDAPPLSQVSRSGSVPVRGVRVPVLPFGLSTAPLVFT